MAFWAKGSFSQSLMGGANTLVALGRLAGLSAAYMVLQQFFFMGRMPYLERVFGLDKLSRLHHTNGKYGLLFLLIHPVLLTLGYASFSGVSLWSQFLSFFHNFEHVDLAIISVLLFIVIVVSSLVIVKNKLKYESWYFVHLLAYLAVFGSFFHQIEVGETLVGNNIFYGYWIALYTLVFTSHLVFRFIRPVVNFFKHKFYVEKVVRENYNTVSVYISGNNLNLFNIYPGQFMILRFLTKGLWWQAHPFSLSMAPNGMNLRVTVKELGDFTRQIQSLKKGTKLIIDGPYGVFTELFSVSSNVLFIAGGIGITPIRGLVEQMSKKQKNMVLLYANRSEEDIVFKNELENFSKQGSLKIVNVLSSQPGYAGETGFVDEEKLKRLVPDLNTREIYLCGPPPMMNGLIRILKALGVQGRRLHFEKFSL